jgi:putative ABC transport system permease protein
VHASRLRRSLVVLETAMALVLLAGAGTLLKTFLTLQGTNPGFETANVLKADLLLPLPQYNEFADRARFYEAAQARVRALPGVRTAAFVSDLPLSGGTDSLAFHVVGRADPAPGEMYSAGFSMVTSGYFVTLGIPLKAGREIADADRIGTPPVVVVNETAARMFWPGQSPIGRQIDMPGSDSTSQAITVVGVTGDVRQIGLGLPPRPEMFLSSLQAPLLWPWTTVVVKAFGDPAALGETVKTAIRGVDPTIAVHRIRTLDEVVAQSIIEPRIYTMLLGAFALLAVLLAAVGLYGLIAYTVSQRKHELGVRVALGATRLEIVRLVLREGLWLVIGGSVLGLAGAFTTTRLLVGLVKSAQPNDPATFALVTAVLGAAAVVASYLPARRAASVDPISALRVE